MADQQAQVFARLLFLLSLLTVVFAVRYEPNWNSLDSRPLPSWYDESKIGIFLHWGVFSVPSFYSEWFWEYWKVNKVPKIVNFMNENYKPDFTYQDFAADFTAELFDPDDWADIFNASGARYVVLTSKHHEGFTNWPSKHAFSWNAMDVGPKRDLVGLLANSIRKKTKMHFGLYHSLFEWFNPLYHQDKDNNYTTDNFVQFKSIPELYEIVNAYKPDVVWSDGAAGPDTYWNSTGFLAWLYNDSPVKDTVVTNDRWGSNGIMCHHGGFFTCDDRYNPGVLQKHKWENAMTIDRYSWGFRREAELKDMLTMEELIRTLVETVSDIIWYSGGNCQALSDIIWYSSGNGQLWWQYPYKRWAHKDGRIVPIFEERLRSLGKWLKVNGEAIYETRPWTFQNDTKTPHVWYTAKKSATGGLSVYAIVLNWPAPGPFYLDSPTPTTSTKISLLGYSTPIGWKNAPTTRGIYIEIPPIPFNKQPCDYAWVFKMEYLY